MTDLEILLKHTIKTLSNTEIVDWNSNQAKTLKKIYEDYHIEKTTTKVVCPCCLKETQLTFCEKVSKKIIYNYCDKCIMLFH